MNTSPINKYLLFFRSTDWYAGLEDEETKEIMTKWSAWYQRLTSEGVVEHGSPLAAGGQIVGKDGAVSDGPFAESKETVGGYFLVNAETFEQALAVAKGCPGLPYGIRVEVRPVLANCQCAENLGVEMGVLASA